MYVAFDPSEFIVPQACLARIWLAQKYHVGSSDVAFGTSDQMTATLEQILAYAPGVQWSGCALMVVNADL